METGDELYPRFSRRCVIIARDNRTLEKLSQRVREKSLSIPPRNLRPIFSSLSVLLYSSKMIHAEDVFYVEERV